MTEKLKIFLTRKLQDYERKITKIKRKRKIIKILFSTSVIISIVCSSVAASITSIFGLPFLPIIITILSSTSAISTALSLKFNLEGKKQQLNNMIININNIKNKLDYVVSCNGDLGENEYNTILNEFTQ